jgi:hypothetical protein
MLGKNSALMTRLKQLLLGEASLWYKHSFGDYLR